MYTAQNHEKFSKCYKLDDWHLRYFILNQKFALDSCIGVYKCFERFLEKLIGIYGWDRDTLLFLQFKTKELRFSY